jgi:hypothetical protein
VEEMDNEHAVSVVVLALGNAARDDRVQEAIQRIRRALGLDGKDLKQPRTLVGAIPFSANRSARQ